MCSRDRTCLFPRGARWRYRECLHHYAVFNQAQARSAPLISHSRASGAENEFADNRLTVRSQRHLQFAVKMCSWLPPFLESTNMPVNFRSTAEDDAQVTTPVRRVASMAHSSGNDMTIRSTTRIIPRGTSSSGPGSLSGFWCFARGHRSGPCCYRLATRTAWCAIHYYTEGPSDQHAPGPRSDGHAVGAGLRVQLWHELTGGTSLSIDGQLEPLPTRSATGPDSLPTPSVPHACCSSVSVANQVRCQFTRSPCGTPLRGPEAPGQNRAIPAGADDESPSAPGKTLRLNAK